MRAAALDFEHRSVSLIDHPDPELAAPDDVLWRVHEAGVCGTDRELAAFDLGRPPAGSSYLIPGHEAVGEVIACGAGVTGLRPGDWVVPAIRRPCHASCRWCAIGRGDMCETGLYQERGIFGLHGYLADFAVDPERFLLPVPASLAGLAVLIEPLSVVEKAVRTALRLHPAEPASALVIGAGTIGSMAGALLTAKGFAVTIRSREPEDSARASWVRRAGMRYQRSEQDRYDIVIEAAGFASAAVEGMHALAPAGVLIVLGARPAAVEFPFLDLIVGNQVVAGSVNASFEDFEQAREHLRILPGPLFEELIERVPLDRFPSRIAAAPGPRPKLVHVI